MGSGWWPIDAEEIDLILKNLNLKTLGRGRIRDWGRQIKATNGPLEVEEESMEMLNPDKASDEANLASEEARKGGGRRKRGIRGKGEDEGVKITPSSLAAGREGWDFFKERGERFFCQRGFSKY